VAAHSEGSGAGCVTATGTTGPAAGPAAASSNPSTIGTVRDDPDICTVRLHMHHQNHQ
jgi:hypothetical protein